MNLFDDPACVWAILSFESLQIYLTLGYYLYTESNGRNYNDNAMLRTVYNYNDNQQYCLRFV